MDLFNEALQEGLARLAEIPDEVLATEPVPEVAWATSLDGERRLVITEVHGATTPTRAVWTGGARIGTIRQYVSGDRWYGVDHHGTSQVWGETAELAAQRLDRWNHAYGPGRCAIDWSTD